MSTNTLSCAGMSTFIGLYKSRPTDFDVAQVGIHAVGNIFKHGSDYSLHICYCFLIMLHCIEPNGTF